MSSRPSIYLDYNATAPPAPGVGEAMVRALEMGGNPSSVHQRGRNARRIVEDARARLADAVGAKPQNVIFTSGGTEANRLALSGVADRTVLASAIEHPSVMAYGGTMASLAVDSGGRVELADLREKLAAQERPALVSLMYANNETGVLQPVAEAAAIAHAAGALVHCDAVQGLGKQEIDLEALGVDMLSVSAHKIGGPAGIGALVLSPGIVLASDRAAGGQERGQRAGTENLAGIAGFGAALAALDGSLSDQPRQLALRQLLERQLVAAGGVVFGAASARLSNTIAVAMSGVASATQLMHFDLAGFCVSAGSACSSGKVERSHVLHAMGVADALSDCAIRISFGRDTLEGDLLGFAAAWKDLCRRKAAA